MASQSASSSTSMFSHFQILQSGFSGPSENDIPLELTYKKLPKWLMDTKLIRKDLASDQYFSKLVEEATKLIDALPSIDESMASSPHNSENSDTNDINTYSQRLFDFKSCFKKKMSLVPWLFTYFDFLEAFELLLSNSQLSKSKTLLGSYKDPLLYSWDCLKSKWIKGNIHLLHAAQTLNQSVKHEFSALKSTKEYCLNHKNTLAVKESNLISTINSEKKHFYQLCALHGVSPSQDLESMTNSSLLDLEQSLLHQVSQAIHAKLPILVQEFISLVKSQKFQQSITFYVEFATFMASKTDSVAVSGSPQSTFLAVFDPIKRLINDGEQLLIPQQDSSNIQILKDAIDNEVVSDEIDWGDFSEPAAESTMIAINSVDISNPDIAKETRLDSQTHITTRRKIASSLEELMMFYRQRLLELSPSSVADHKKDFIELVMGRSLASIPDHLRLQDNPSTLGTYLESVSEAKKKFEDITDTFLLAESNHRMNSVVSKIIQSASKFLRLGLELVATREKMLDNEHQLEDNTEALSEAQKSISLLNSHLEKSVSLLHHGRPVHIQTNIE